ncbi:MULTISPECIES: MarR family winged helix-turn-helix transcriptional regulator [Mammaliicoccus]|uniref:HTH-type transcriptional regulator SarZ n=1 Tax=Mammaliicoccus fleurettii TaxID=150056 RepID=A0ABS5MME5_9STAP|nr:MULTISPECIES: MarR family transcriptional regulator [Mammaliicoccus]MBL0847350.1 MarR family transcriptional regulator [Mammaliicoccus fleurettii]MBO3063396.1 MarR family transcriptional regulator [Mammaliicoccus fleurettii]MBS3672231.1 MarR family transcriptional regulator [Mammaliicoccus fleurettii]MBS3697100.1 MarR family transcriptional regulator [Mammaliicoccus fleurettii]MBW0765200.1 MarR family transcriptional regulator [Mammaliicoccus fleurettii]
METPPINKQLGFLLYVASKELIKKYTPILKKYNLTYTGYIVLVAIDKNEVINIKTLGDRLYLDSGTLTPLLKKLEEKGFINRERAINDERNLRVSLTEQGIETQSEISEEIVKVFQGLEVGSENSLELRDSIEKFIQTTLNKDISE